MARTRATSGRKTEVSGRARDMQWFRRLFRRPPVAPGFRLFPGLPAPTVLRLFPIPGIRITGRLLPMLRDGARRLWPQAWVSTYCGNLCRFSIEARNSQFRLDESKEGGSTRRSLENPARKAGAAGDDGRAASALYQIASYRTDCGYRGRGDKPAPALASKDCVRHGRRFETGPWLAEPFRSQPVRATQNSDY